VLTKLDVQNLSLPAMGIAPLVALVSAFLVGLLGFALKSAIGGRPRTERVIRQGGTILLGEYLMEYGLWLFRPITRACVRLNLHPDVLSWTSLLLHLLAAVALGGGHFGLGGSLLLAGAACDALDGAVARARGLSSDSGELLDASVDRWAEMAIFVAYAWYYRTFPLGFFLSAAALMGAVMVSYVRAKGESMGIVVTSGLMQRHERAVYLCGATIVSAIGTPFWEPNDPVPVHYLVLAALALIALFANWTAFHRFALIRRELRRKGR
jgi:CDP-diacylglycerol--glycerol-3-phosphate 3-phosphatidyltransferase